jgi:hypothetical protein
VTQPSYQTGPASTTTRLIALSREGVVFRLSFEYNPTLVERMGVLPYAYFDSETRTWTTQVCTQSVEILREWYNEGLVDVVSDAFVAPGEQLVTVGPAMLRPGSLRRPYQVSPAFRDDRIFTRLRAIPGASWVRTSRSISYPQQAASALVELIEKGIVDDPEKILSPADVTVSFDARTGIFLVRGDERAQVSFNKYFPAQDIVKAWHEKSIDVAFTDSFSEEVYRGELARVTGGPTPVGMHDGVGPVSLWPYQAQSVAVALERTGFGVFHDMGLGKALKNGTKVYTPTGHKNIEDLIIGDSVIGRDGKPTVVTGVFPQGALPLYNVTFNDGATITTCGEHLWAVQNVQNGHRHPEAWLTKSTKELMTDLMDGAKNLKWKIPIVGPIQFDGSSVLPLDPYLLGLLLGDGSITKRAEFITSDAELLEQLQARLPVGCTTVFMGRYHHNIVGNGKIGGNPILLTLRELGLLGHGAYTKFIPEAYLFSSPENRLAILRGLMDTDGTAGPDGTNEFSTASKQLAADVEFLTQSLGGIARRSIKVVKGKPYNRVNVKLMECPFLLTRKAAAWKQPTKYKPSRNIKSITTCGKGEATCIAVDAPDQLYVTEHCIVTHNTVIAIAAGHELLFNRNEISRNVVVVPGSVRTQWSKEIERFSHGEVVVIDGDLKHRKAGYEAAKTAPWLVVNYDVLARDEALLTPLINGALLIADEAHRLKNPTAKRTKTMRKFAARAERRLALTGTPIQNDPGEWYSVISGFVTPGVFGSPQDFLNRYAYPGRFGGWEGARNLGELRERSSTYYIRYTKPEVAQHLPPLRVQHRPLDVDPAYRQALQRAHREARDEIKAAALDVAHKVGRIGHILDGQDIDEVTAGAEMTAVSMLRLLCSSPRIVTASDSPSAKAMVEAGLLPDADGPKLDELRSMATELQEEGQRVVIFTFSKRMANLIADRFAQDGIRHVLFTGDTSSKDRDARVAAFTTPSTPENPGPTAFIATDAGGEGLNLGAQCSLLINVDIPWTPGVLAQRSARIHRIDGTAEKYLVINFTLKGTIEEGILRMIERKADLQDAIFGEGGGRTRTTGRGGRSVFEEAMADWESQDQ